MGDWKREGRGERIGDGGGTCSAYDSSAPSSSLSVLSSCSASSGAKNVHSGEIRSSRARLSVSVPDCTSSGRGSLCSLAGVYWYTGNV